MTPGAAAPSFPTEPVGVGGGSQESLQVTVQAGGPGCRVRAALTSRGSNPWRPPCFVFGLDRLGSLGGDTPQTKNPASGRAGLRPGTGTGWPGCARAQTKARCPPLRPTPPPPPGPQHLACSGPPAALHPAPSQRRWVFPHPAPEREGDAARGPPASAALGGRLLSGPGPPSPESFPEASAAKRTHCRRAGSARSVGDRSESSGRSESYGHGQRVPPPRTRPVGCPSRALLAGAQAGGAGPPHHWGSGCSAMLGGPRPVGTGRGEELGRRGGGGARAGPTNPAPRRGSARRGCCSVPAVPNPSPLPDQGE